MFKERTNKTIVKAIEELMPKVIITPKALNKMEIYVSECNDEIGWLGTAYKEGKIIKIDDVYLFDQEVHSTTTEITPEGLSQFAEELLQQPNGIEIWNNIKVWGHSHVRMTVTPSAQDNAQMAEFANSGHDWFLRIIANKNGELKVDLFDFKNGVIFEDVKWSEGVSEEQESIFRKIQELYKLLDESKKQSMEQIKEPVKEEMKAKVRKKVYVYNGYNYYQNKNAQIGFQGNVITKKNEENKKETKRNKELLEFFSEDEIIDIAECYGYYWADNYIEQIARGLFTEAEKIQIWNLARNKVFKDYTIKGV